MNRREIFLGAISLLASTIPAFAGRRRQKVRFNFTSDFDETSKPLYEGKEVVSYWTSEKPGTIIVNTKERALYFILANGQAIKYGVGVGRQGFSWKGTADIRRKAKWPTWFPPETMRKRELLKYGRVLPERMKGGPKNPLGARALYLFQGKRDTLYRIHGTNNPRSIGRAMSSGCVRLLNEEVMDLYKRVKIGAKVIVI